MLHLCACRSTESVEGRGERSKISSFAKFGAMDTIFGAACKKLWGEQVSFVVRMKNNVVVPAEIKAWLLMGG